MVSSSASFPPSSLLQGSQDSAGGQEGLVATPFSAFPPPPPPQNGLAGTEFGPGAMFAAGGQGTAEVAAGANVAGGSGGSGGGGSSSNNSINVSKRLLCVFTQPGSGEGSGGTLSAVEGWD